MKKTSVPERISFRTASPKDASSIAVLHAESWKSAYRGILPDEYLDGPIDEDRRMFWQMRLLYPHQERQLVLLAAIPQAMLGFVCVLLDEDPEWGACLDNLHVLPVYKGRGLGTQLFGRAAQWVMNTKPGWPMHLWVFEENHAACRFYDKLGGKISGRQVKHVAGFKVPSLRYIWDDLDTLVMPALAESRGEKPKDSNPRRRQ